VTRRRLPKEDLPLVALAKRTWRDLVEVTQFVLHDPPLAIALLQIALAPTLLPGAG